MTATIRLTDQPIFPDILLKTFLEISIGAGAVVSFCGIARPQARSGSAVSGLRLEHHPTMTFRSIERIAGEAKRRFQIPACMVVHRYGLIMPNETIVFVAAASPHRRAAFLAADYMMDCLKTEAVFWKKEEGVDGGRWIEPTDADRADVARWGD